VELPGGECDNAMTPKTKIVEFSGTRYQVRKLSPDVGSFILGKALMVGIKASEESAASNGDAVAAPDKAAPEDMARAIAFSFVFRGADFETHRFVQGKCLAVCSRMESKDGGPELPMPIVNDAGAWAIPEIRDDVALVMRLEVEVLAFNFTDFFAVGGLNAMAGQVSAA